MILRTGVRTSKRLTGVIKMRKLIIPALICVLCAGLFAGCADEGTEGTSQASSAASSSSGTSVSSAGSSSDTKDKSEEKDKDESEEFEIPDETEDGIKIVEGEYDPEKYLKLEDYMGMKLERLVAAVTDKNIDEYMQSVFPAEVLDDPNATVQDGDTVNVAYVGEINGEEFEGGTSDSYYLVIGSEQFIEGFEEGLIGMKAGETKDLELKFPDDYWDPKVAGSPVTFHVTINDIRRRPEITDELVQEKTAGEYSTYEEYREFARKELERMNENSSRQQLKEDAWNEIYNNAEFTAVPRGYVQEGVDAYRTQIETEAAYNSMSLKEYLDYAGVSLSEYYDMLLTYGMTIAQSKVIVSYIWDKEGLTEDEEYQAIFQEMLDMYGLDEESLNEALDQEVIDRYCRTQRMLQYVVDHAEITDRTVDEISG